MEESAIKGLKSLELDDRDAHVRKTRTFSDISVEGYDTGLQNYVTRVTLRKHFASCGKVLAVSVFKSFALMRIEGEDAKDKALQLSGTDVGGWIPIVKAAPWQMEPYEPCAARKKEWRMFVSGYDTCLPEIDIQLALCNHLSSCGKIITITVLPARGRAFVVMRGDNCVEKALKLSGQVGGMNLVVNPNVLRPENSGKRKRANNFRPIGYTPPSYALELEKRKEKMKEKMKKEKEKEKEKKKMKKKVEKALY